MAEPMPEWMEIKENLAILKLGRHPPIRLDAMTARRVPLPTAILRHDRYVVCLQEMEGSDYDRRMQIPENRRKNHLAHADICDYI